MVSIPPSPAMRLYSLLFSDILEPEFARLQRKLTAIADRQLASGAASNIMLVEGQLVAPPVRIGARPAPVHSALEDELKALMKEIKNFGLERTYIRHSLSVLVPDDAYTYQEYRDCLSDLVGNNIFCLAKIKRSRPPHYHISHDNKKMEIWNKAEGLLEFYLANRLIFS